MKELNRLFGLGKFPGNPRACFILLKQRSVARTAMLQKCATLNQHDNAVYWRLRAIILFTNFITKTKSLWKQQQVTSPALQQRSRMLSPANLHHNHEQPAPGVYPAPLFCNADPVKLHQQHLAATFPETKTINLKSHPYKPLIYFTMSLTPILSINVKDYGATGNGSTDDTVKIQDAVAAVVSLTQAVSLPTGQAYLSTGPTLYFPPGIYIISAPILLPQAIKIVGDNAILMPPSTAERTFNAFSFANTYDVRIERMTFTAFDTAVAFPGGNLDSSRIVIDGCVFRSSNTGVLLGSVSTLSNIVNSKFYNNTMAVDILTSDSVTIKDCWIYAGEMYSPEPGPGIEVRSCQVRNNGILHFENNLLVPAPPAAGTIEPAWINNYAYVKAANLRQGGEPGSFTLVNNFAGTAGLVSGGPMQTAVIVKDSICMAVYGNIYRDPTGFVYAQPAAIRFIKVPNLTVLKNNVGFVDCKAIDCSLHAYHDDTEPTVFDPAKITAMLAASGASTSITAIEVANNSGPYLFPLGPDPQKPQLAYIPEQLYPFARTNESLWPNRRRPVLPQSATTLSGNVSTYTFDLAAGFYNGLKDKTFLLRFSGDPLLGGSSMYSGGIVGILRINGTYTASALQFALVYKELFNQIATPGSFLSGTFGVVAKWQATGTDLLPFTSLSQTDQQFVVEITGADALVNLELIVLDDL